MKLYFVRHGDKERSDVVNPALGHLDQNISRIGRHEAKRLVRFFAGRRIERICISNYIRTYQTALPLIKRLKIDPEEDSRLNEIDIGDVELLSDEEVSRRYPEFWDHYQSRNADFRFPGGETGEEALSRAVAFLSDARSGRRDTLAFTHDGLIRLLCCHVLGLPVYQRFRLRVETCGIMELDWPDENDSPILVRFNQKI